MWTLQWTLKVYRNAPKLRPFLDVVYITDTFATATSPDLITTQMISMHFWSITLPLLGGMWAIISQLVLNILPIVSLHCRKTTSMTSKSKVHCDGNISAAVTGTVVALPGAILGRQVVEAPAKCGILLLQIGIQSDVYYSANSELSTLLLRRPKACHWWVPVLQIWQCFRASTLFPKIVSMPHTCISYPFLGKPGRCSVFFQQRNHSMLI